MLTKFYLKKKKSMLNEQNKEEQNMKGEGEEK
jgi:hypothetical protein